LHSDQPEVTTAMNTQATTVKVLFSLDATPLLPVSTRPEQHLVALIDEHSLSAEKFRMLANRLVSVRHSRELKIVHVTSSVVGEGKSLVAANLAVTFARRPRQRVLLLEGDLRKPSLARLLGVGPVSGLGEWWENGSGEEESNPPIYRVDGLQLWLLPAGKTARPTDIMQSPRVPELLSRVAELFDWVIIDSPPLLPVADAGLWARWSDGTLLVVRAGVPPKKALRKGLESLDNARFLGMVLNDAPDQVGGKYYHRYYGLYAHNGKVEAPVAKLLPPKA